jgi:hypothetical protein
VRYPANTMEDMRKLLLGYPDNMRVEVESGVAVKAKTVADLRALPTWPGGLILDIHVDLDPRSSVVRVERGVLIQLDPTPNPQEPIAGSNGGADRRREQRSKFPKSAGGSCVADLQSKIKINTNVHSGVKYSFSPRLSH